MPDAAIKRVKLCRCRSQEITLFLVFSFDYNKRLLSLRAIDRSVERADEHVLMIQQEARILGNRIRVWVENNSSDHAFAAGMYEFKGLNGEDTCLTK